MKKLKLFLLVWATVITYSSKAQEKLVSLPIPTVIHTVLFKFNATATPTQVNELMDSIKALQTKIPGILKISSGQNFSARSKGYTHAVTIIFASKRALEKFIPDHIHQKLISDLIKPILSEMIIIDYEDKKHQ